MTHRTAPLGRRRLLVGTAAVAVAGLRSASSIEVASAASSPLPAIPLRMHVALTGAKDGAGVVADAFIASQLAACDRLYAPHDVSFVELARERGSIPATHARLEDARARDALADHLAPGALDVFFVGFLRDVDDPVLERMGVTWRKRSDLAKRYVVVSAAARETTLAHEIGHFLGNGHTTVVDNLMSYARTGGPVSLDATQGATCRRTARALFARRALDPSRGQP